jgi:hypothetical protein
MTVLPAGALDPTVPAAAGRAGAVARLDSGRPGKSGWRRAVSLTVGGLVLIGLPLALGTRGPEYRDLTSLVAALVQFSLAWGLALALAGWLESRLAVIAVGTVAATVAVFGLVRVAGLPFAWTRGTDLRIIVLVMLFPVVVAAVLADRARRDAQFPALS